MRRLRALMLVLPVTVLTAGLGLGLSDDLRRMPSMLLDKGLTQFGPASPDEDGKCISSADLKTKVSPVNILVIDHSGRVHLRHAVPLSEDVWHEIFEPVLAQPQI